MDLKFSGDLKGREREAITISGFWTDSQIFSYGDLVR